MRYLGKCLFSIILSCLHTVCGQGGGGGGKYVIPKVDIDVFTPKGFRASIPDAPNLTLFAFQGQIQRRFEDNSLTNTINGEVHQPADNGRWTFVDNSIELRVGDVVNYFVIVSVKTDGYVKDNLSFNVTELKDRSGTSTSSVDQTPAEGCQPSTTIVDDAAACAGQVVFEDHFDSLQENLWQIEHKIPIEHPEFPFVSYQKILTGNPTAWVEDGYLKIKPRLQQSVEGFSNDTIYSGVLDLFNGCTGTSQSCSMQASGANILPPVISARLISKRFHFKYGSVEVRAKFPQGDWIYPEILLEPFLKKYGSLSFASGVLKIASARGNRALYSGSTSYGNEVLYGGAVIDSRCSEALLLQKSRSDGKMWGDDFHTYILRWAPDRITLSVDGQEWGRIEPAASGLMGKLPVICRDNIKWPSQGKLAPFDEEFYLTLGVAVGGITEFKDGLQSTSTRPKPWRNHASKAKLTFWQDLRAWYPTWADAVMLIDYVKVVAL